MKPANRKKLIYGITLAALAAVLISFLAQDEKNTGRQNGLDTTAGEEYLTYKNSEYGPAFTYPASWGDVTLRPGTLSCPEEDTYRTPDTLGAYDWEFSFPERRLPGSDSFVRTGIRMRALDPAKPNDCGDAFLLTIARGEMIPESLSSFRLSSVTLESGLEGVYNPEASRLNTEARTHYTLFVPSGEILYAIQPYMSFIPHFASPELAELEGNFRGDMERYLAEGLTAGAIRAERQHFHRMARSLRFSAE